MIASEDWNGMREDFKMASDVITFRVDYAPRVSIRYLYFTLFYFQSAKMPARVSIEDYKNGTAQHAKVQVLSLYLHRQLDDTTWIVKDSQDVTKLNISNPKHAMNLKAGSYIKLVNAVRFCI